MKIDVLDKAHFRLFEDNIFKVIHEIQNNMDKMAGLLMQLQDRIKMLEDKK